MKVVLEAATTKSNITYTETEYTYVPYNNSSHITDKADTCIATAC
jgi:hypothetical protein